MKPECCHGVEHWWVWLAVAAAGCVTGCVSITSCPSDAGPPPLHLSRARWFSTSSLLQTKWRGILARPCSHRLCVGFHRFTAINPIDHLSLFLLCSPKNAHCEETVACHFIYLLVLIRSLETKSCMPESPVVEFLILVVGLVVGFLGCSSFSVVLSFHFHFFILVDLSPQVSHMSKKLNEARCCHKLTCVSFSGWNKTSLSLDASEEHDGYSSAEDPLNSDPEDDNGKKLVSLPSN